MQSLLSIVIPTRNRQDYCIAAIKNILSYNKANFELCIQDNSDNNNIELFINSFYKADNRLKYNYVPQQLNSVHNMDKAVGMATGEYVCMIGDDDTVLENIFEIAEWANENEIQSIGSKTQIDYLWPGAMPNHSDGVLVSTAFKSNFELVNIEVQVNKLLKNGIIEYLTYFLPKVYHGIVKLSLMKEVQRKTGHFFGGLSPDIFACISLCSFCSKHIVLEQPFTIAGACRSSSSSQTLFKEHRGDLSKAPHLILRGNYCWDTRIPDYYSVETIWAETALKAAEETNNQKLLSNFNYYKFCAYALFINRNFFKKAFQKSINNKQVKNKFIAFIKILWYLNVIIFIKIKNRLIGSRRHPLFTYNINNIDEAAKIINSNLKNIN